MQQSCENNTMNEIKDIISNLSQEEKNSLLVETIFKLPQEEKVSLLFEAIQKGQKDSIVALIRCGANAEVKDNERALILAAKHGLKEIAYLLISKYHANVEAIDGYRQKTALMKAAKHGHMGTIDMLIECGAKVEAIDNHKMTALMKAAENGQTHTIDMLISKYNANFDAIDDNKMTVLMHIVRNGYKDTVYMFMSKYRAKVEAIINAKNDYGRTALMYAAENGNIDIANMLISCNADVTAIDDNGKTALMYMYDYIVDTLNKLSSESLSEKITPIRIQVDKISGLKEMPTDEKLKELGKINRQLLELQAFKREQEKLDEEKLQVEVDHAGSQRAQGSTNRTVDVEKLEDIFKLSKEEKNSILLETMSTLSQTEKDLLLFNTAQNGQEDSTKALIKCGANINFKALEHYGMTALMRAAENGHTDTADKLILYGANVNDKDNYGMTALMHAAENGHTDTADKLILYGANVNDKDNDGMTALMHAAKNGHINTADKLISHGANVNDKDNDGMTALMHAAKNGHINTADKLISHGANVNDGDNSGMTALMHAADNGYVDAVDKLISHGANVKAISNNRMTALMYAAENGHTDTVYKLFSEYNVDVDSKDKEGRTALICAAINGHTDTAHMLINTCCADIEAKHIIGGTALLEAVKYGHTDLACMFINVGADLAGADLLKVDLAHINSQNQIQFMYIYANDQLNKAKTLNSPFSRNLDEKISQIRSKADKIYNSTGMSVDEQRKALGEINKQLLKLQYFDIRPEKLQEEKLLAESIYGIASTLIPDLIDIIIDFEGSQRGQIDGILSSIPVIPIAPQALPSPAARTPTTLGIGSTALASALSQAVPSLSI